MASKGLAWEIDQGRPEDGDLFPFLTLPETGKKFTPNEIFFAPAPLAFPRDSTLLGRGLNPVDCRHSASGSATDRRTIST